MNTATDPLAIGYDCGYQAGFTAGLAAADAHAQALATRARETASWVLRDMRSGRPLTRAERIARYKRNAARSAAKTYPNENEYAAAWLNDQAEDTARATRERDERTMQLLARRGVAS